MRLPSRGRMLLLVLGGVVVLAGAVAWFVGITVGGEGLRPELITEIDGDTVRIYEFDEHGPLDSEGQPVQSLVFEGSEAEADAFMSEPQAEDRNYLVPALIIAVGAVIVIVALIPVPKTQMIQAARWIGLVLFIYISWLYLLSGRLDPTADWLLRVLWLVFLVALIMVWRSRPWLVLVTPVLAYLTWVFVVLFGESFLG